MHKAIKVADGTYWVGTNDYDTTWFENLWPLPKGVSYNAYLIKDEKIALIDAVKKGFITDLLQKLKPRLEGGLTVDYLIINHMEPDHSGGIQVLREIFPKMILVGNAKTLNFVKQFYGITEGVREVKDGETLSLGQHELTFHLTPMVHWPETMMTLDAHTGVLFSGDAFGGFGALPGGIFDEDVDIDYYEEETLRYFTNIVAKYAGMTTKAINKMADKPIKIVAATHGPIWRKDPKRIIEKYARWSAQETEDGVAVVYGSMYGNTEMMVEALTRGLAKAGMDKVRVHNVSRTHGSFILNDIWRYKALVFAAPTYNVGLFPLMDDMMRRVEALKLKDRVVGVLGTYGWSGGGVKSIKAYCERCKFEVLEPVVEAHCSATEADLQQCRDLGAALAARLQP